MVRLHALALVAGHHGRFLLCPGGTDLAMWDDRSPLSRGSLGVFAAVDHGTRSVTC